GELVTVLLRSGHMTKVGRDFDENAFARLGAGLMLGLPPTLYDGVEPFTVISIRSDASSSSATTSSPSHARAQGDEKLAQLLERLAHPTSTPGGDGTVESFLRGIEVVHDEQRLAAFLIEGHRGDGPTVTTFVIRPDEARVR